ncbi:DNA-directed RNA polymerase subunit beta [Nocardia farcinica]|nr:DNA-directed RNA polymerase subunit beta [Nocardia farcinica]
MPVPVLDTPVSRCRFYRSVCDLPAVVRPETDRITVRAGHIGAVTMPAVLGGQVRLHLRRHNLGGPIISHPRSKRWTYLVQPDFPQDVPTFSEMFRLNVTITSPGADIALPTPSATGVAFRLWVDQPTNPFRPSGRAVIESIRACLASGSAGSE